MTVAEVAELLAVPQDKVLAWIRSGQLRAYNLTVKRGLKQRYRVSPADLDTFLATRETKPAPIQPPRRRTYRGRDFVEFIK